MSGISSSATRLVVWLGNYDEDLADFLCFHTEFIHKGHWHHVERLGRMAVGQNEYLEPFDGLPSAEE